ncbi:MAG TPA: hypothetical protein VGN18_11245 [Jatrophihabitans sp.]|uniref:hypothetical protein n=1 Tax=Jatrophihabitans sp. TaxID=1932789 RepID=UPI002E0948F8|nr:hypothetical protein [Jatrophihabitans sp.]
MSDVGRIGQAPAAGDPGAAESAAVTRFLDDLRSLGEGPAPEPSPELAALLAGVPTLAAARRHRPRIVRRVALIAAAVVAGTTLAAANHQLPAPAQRVVSNVVNDLTPFHIDNPHPVPTPTTPAVTPTPTTKPPTHVAPPPERSSEDTPEPGAPHSSTEAGDEGAGGSGGSGEATPTRGGDGEHSTAAPTHTSDGGSESESPGGGRSDGGGSGGSDGGTGGGTGGGD